MFANIQYLVLERPVLTDTTKKTHWSFAVKLEMLKAGISWLATDADGPTVHQGRVYRPVRQRVA